MRNKEIKILKTIACITCTVIPSIVGILFAMSAQKIIVDNLTTLDLGNPSFAYDNTTYKIQMRIPITFQNTGYLDVAKTQIIFALENSTRNYPFDILTIPLLHSGEKSGSLNFTMSLNNNASLMDFLYFTGTITGFDLEIITGIFLFPIKFHCRISQELIMIPVEWSDSLST